MQQVGKFLRMECRQKVIRMVAGKAVVTRELDNLIDQQIQTLKQRLKISESELGEYRQRSQRIRILCQTLNPGRSPGLGRQPVRLSFGQPLVTSQSSDNT